MSTEKARAYTKRWIAENKDRFNQKKREWALAHPEEFKVYRKAWRAKNKDRDSLLHRRSHLKRTYGLTLEDYDRMLRSQGNSCAICGGADPKTKKNRFCVDHDHGTGGVRALLCLSCNQMIGNGGDDPALLRKGATYLESFATKARVA